MVENLNISATEDTPEVIMNGVKGFISFSGTSWAEDALSFYKPLIQWIKDYFEKPQPKTDIEFNLSYFNTSSAKQIAKLITAINECKNKNQIFVKWYYEREDHEMLKIGQKYSSILNLNFQFIETEPVVDKDDYQEGVYQIVK